MVIVNLAPILRTIKGTIGPKNAIGSIIGIVANAACKGVKPTINCINWLIENITPDIAKKVSIKIIEEIENERCLNSLTSNIGCFLFSSTRTKASKNRRPKPMFSSTTELPQPEDGASVIP